MLGVKKASFLYNKCYWKSKRIDFSPCLRIIVSWRRKLFSFKSSGPNLSKVVLSWNKKNSSQSLILLLSNRRTSFIISVPFSYAKHLSSKNELKSVSIRRKMWLIHLIEARFNLWNNAKMTRTAFKNCQKGVQTYISTILISNI